MSDSALRHHLIRLLDWEEAHVGFDTAIDGIPVDRRAAHATGFERSPWELVEHMRLAQEDILDFCVNANYEHKMKWPDDYWPGPTPPSDAGWNKSVASFTRSRAKVKALIRDVEDITAKVPTGKGSQTYLRAFLLVADHAAYHVGQLVAVRRALGIWGPR
jgi:hypothetical protein